VLFPLILAQPPNLERYAQSDCFRQGRLSADRTSSFAASFTFNFSGQLLSRAECGPPHAGHLAGVIKQQPGIILLWRLHAVWWHLCSLWVCALEHIGHISPRALQPAIGCPNFQHLWHCVVADACHITADVLYFPINRSDGVTLSTSASGTLIIIEVTFLSLLSSSFGLRNFALAISNLCVTMKAFWTSSSRSLSLFGIVVSDTPLIMTSTWVGALLNGRYLGSSGLIVPFRASVILSMYFAYCPESVPAGAVRVIVPFVLLEKNLEIGGCLAFAAHQDCCYSQ